MKVTRSPEEFEMSSRDLDGTPSCDVEEFANDLTTCIRTILDSCHSFSYSSGWFYSSSPSIRFHIGGDAIRREKAPGIILFMPHDFAPRSSRASSHQAFSLISDCLASLLTAFR
jgi:hypothetical protein